ncbi:hypothetical protein BDP81DRAFT_435095 [Colletotrichum phormii]|uniref:Uncharacterized protein n=1 Tax=Colletotrichum phormii TaxID=359342 RepID=A0AAI9ZJA7_9PEZI|nr:uncharacterized protein BDP81DRAFT_435095 [Colletotrichum phormii]KAK1625632.1 hypothetical protein BDP81DRAFT_435095 [Colletotrichum phormii]
MGFIVRSNCPLPLLIRYATLLVSLQAQAVLGIHLQLLFGVAIADKGTVVRRERADSADQQGQARTRAGGRGLSLSLCVCLSLLSLWLGLLCV